MPITKTYISVILPTFNEAGNIVPLIHKIIKNLGRNKFEILVIDDNSTDGTAKSVRLKFRRRKNIRIFVRTKNKGLASAISLGIEKTRGNYILVMDTDFNHDPQDLPRLIKNCHQFDLVIGSRYIKGGGMENKWRYIASFLYNKIISIPLGLKTHDNLSGFFIMKKYGLRNINMDKIFYGYGDYFIRLLYFAQKKHFSVCEIPVFYKNRTWGESKSDFLPMFLDYTKTVVNILFRR